MAWAIFCRCPATRKDGKRISIGFTITMLKNAEGEITGMIAVLRDITARFEELKVKLIFKVDSCKRALSAEMFTCRAGLRYTSCRW